MEPSGLAQTITLRVNGENHLLAIEARVSLLDALREWIGLTATKKGCNEGACGACTVLADCVRVNACLILAMQCEGHKRWLHFCRRVRFKQYQAIEHAKAHPTLSARLTLMDGILKNFVKTYEHLSRILKHHLELGFFNFLNTISQVIDHLAQTSRHYFRVYTSIATRFVTHCEFL